VSSATCAAISRKRRADSLWTEHKFKIGQLVHYYPRKIGRASIDLVSGLYQIIKRLPSPNGEPQYEIRSTLEQHDRVATESELTGA
jgi:hypothetical protein